MHVTKDDGWFHTSRAITLHPSVFGETESGELFAEIFDHVGTFKLAMHQHIKTDIFLTTNARRDLVLQELFIANEGKFTTLETCTGGAHFLRLGE